MAHCLTEIVNFWGLEKRAIAHGTYIMKRVGCLIDIICYQWVNTYEEKEEKSQCRPESLQTTHLHLWYIGNSHPWSLESWCDSLEPSNGKDFVRFNFCSHNNNFLLLPLREIYLLKLHILPTIIQIIPVQQLSLYHQYHHHHQDYYQPEHHYYHYHHLY